ncbi:hypothetical protein [Pseudomonas putida]|uniref:Uncharacterized protein n=1 Tax=Pseudomonas putida TaxID=303 RepID=A0A8I1ECZ5_PSEPU|nr:hypothetical protein [Pseudomonas putida]MBI6882993.1 hypothetical protein [Pseudomonas putida]
MKPIVSITAAVIAAAATMAHANASVNIVSVKASESAKSSAKALLNRPDMSYLVDSNIKGLSVALKMDDKPLKIDVGSMLAAYESDSTTKNVYNPVTSSCYSNCYTNCHGSRSWR